MPSLKWHSSQFKVLKTLGEGTFGEVLLVEDQQNASEHKKFALKVLNKKMLRAKNVEECVKREIEIQTHLRHPTILKCYGYFHDEGYVYMVLDYMETTIYDELRRQPYNRFTEKQSAQIMWYVADALAFIHERGVVHRDIKPANILTNRDGTVKLADFGMAVISRDERRRSICGSRPYMAPEIFRSESYTFSVDLWSMGILCHELITGRRPEHHDHGLTISVSVSKQGKDLISRLTASKPEERLSATEIKEHQWIKAQIP